jgi:hypothetical protein
MIGPTLFRQTFAYFIRSDSSLDTQHSTLSSSLDLPGAPFLLASLMLLSAAVLAWRSTKAEDLREAVFVFLVKVGEMHSTMVATSLTAYCYWRYGYGHKNETMNKKAGQPMGAVKDSFLAPSSSLLDNHIDEITETSEEILGLVALLKTLSPTDSKRDEYEGRLYGALTHLDHHVKPAIKEWDRVVDRMPED